ncbi:hypothetical protein LPJ73_006137 [Coemansia sp. RSA 2703]|nr:hypothetical protein LPJ73_006137 [Coemansia sp. RSA 2703]KAJ2373821.1 hypothetical protein IW150_003434 [Coemansia sp. RSA 2607]
MSIKNASVLALTTLTILGHASAIQTGDYEPSAQFEAMFNQDSKNAQEQLKLLNDPNYLASVSAAMKPLNAFLFSNTGFISSVLSGIPTPTSPVIGGGSDDDDNDSDSDSDSNSGKDDDKSNSSKSSAMATKPVVGILSVVGGLAACIALF